MTRPSDYERAQLCYQTAYFLIPQFLFEEPARFAERFAEPDLAARLFYLMNCSLQHREPVEEDVCALKGHVGQFNDDLDYFIVEYPPFPPVDLGECSPEDFMQRAEKIVLAPYFSAALVSTDGHKSSYYILGQSPAAGTTLRQVTRQHNANLGPGCAPVLSEFLALLRSRPV